MEKALKKTLSRGQFEFVTAKRSRTMFAIKSRGNKSTELRFKLALVRRGICGWKMHQNVAGTCPDFYFASRGLAIFVDGCFWHGCPCCGHIPKTNQAFWETKIRINIQRDLNNNGILIHNGIKVLRFWEHHIAANLDACIQICSGVFEDSKIGKPNSR